MSENAGHRGIGPRVAVVLSGGGARGAYEAGVLADLLDELPHRPGHRVRFDAEKAADELPEFFSADRGRARAASEA